MGGIAKEYRCLAHGPFVGTEAVCPAGCTMTIEREFRTAPGLKSPRTRNIDTTLKALAADFGLTNLSNKKGAVAGGARRNDLAPSWKELPKGDQLQVGKGLVKQKGAAGGAAAAATAHRVAGALPNETAFADITGGLHQPRPQVDPKLVYADRATLLEASKKAA